MVALPILAIKALADFFQVDVPSAHSRIATYLLLILVGVVGAVASMSQLSFPVALLGRGIRDQLTRCFTRSSMEEILEFQFVIATRSKAPLTLAFVELDDFKSDDDGSAMAASDALLAGVVERIVKILRRGDVIGRWSEQEFVFMFPNSSIEQTNVALDRLRSMGLGTRADGRPVTLSVGLAERMVEGAGHWSILVEQSNRRMQRARGAGGSVVSQ